MVLRDDLSEGERTSRDIRRAVIVTAGILLFTLGIVVTILAARQGG